MRCLVGIDDTDSSRGFCTTYLAYRIAVDLRPDVEVIPYPRLVRLNPNIPFKTRGNAAVCLSVETRDPALAFELVSSKVTELSDVEGGANSGLVFLDDPGDARLFDGLYSDALTGMVSPGRVRRILKDRSIRTMELGNGMGIVGAASALAFDERLDHTYELIAYRRPESRGTKREVDPASVFAMDHATFPRTYNNCDYQKKKVLVAPHGPDPVLMGVRGDSPSTVLEAYGMLSLGEEPEGHIVYISNQHTDAHLQRELQWKVYSSGFLEGVVQRVEVGVGGHVYFDFETPGGPRRVAAYEPTSDLRRTARLLRKGDFVRVYGSVRRATSLHTEVLNMEKLEVLWLSSSDGKLVPGTYLASPRANRHLTKPLVRYGQDAPSSEDAVSGWLSPAPTLQPMLAGSR